MFTLFTGSNGSWEDRSVGGEIEESIGARQRLETHFDHGEDGSDLDLPRTVLHHPDPFVSTIQRTQRPSYAGRPSSSMLEQYPSYHQTRPQSAMDTSYYPQSTLRRMPTPNGPTTTSVKSVFDCELGCFVEDHEMNHDLDSTKATPSKSACCESPITPTSPVSNISTTSDPKEV